MVIGAASSAVPSTLLGLTRFQTNTMENVNAFSDTNILALINIHYREIQTFLLSNIMGQWKENTTDGTGSGLINLVAGTANYSLPTDLMTIDKIEIDYAGETNTFKVAKIIKMGALDDTEALANTSDYNSRFSTEADPVVIIRSNKIELGKIPEESITGGIKVYYTSLITDLVVGTGASSTPVFNGAFHQLLSAMASVDWLRSNDQSSKAELIARDIVILKENMLNFYVNRDSDDQVSLEVKYRNYK